MDIYNYFTKWNKKSFNNAIYQKAELYLEL